MTQHLVTIRIQFQFDIFHLLFLLICNGVAYNVFVQIMNFDKFHFKNAALSVFNLERQTIALIVPRVYAES